MMGNKSHNLHGAKTGSGKYTFIGGETVMVSKSGLKIVFNNPNTQEELANVLARIAAECLYKRLVEEKQDKSTLVEGANHCG